MMKWIYSIKLYDWMEAEIQQTAAMPAWLAIVLCLKSFVLGVSEKDDRGQTFYSLP